MKTSKRAAGRRSLSDDEFHAIGRALADPRRFAMLEQIAKAECLACSSLREQGVISPATISHHVKELAEAGLIEVERQGRTAQLTLCRDSWNAYLKRLARL